MSGSGSYGNYEGNYWDKPTNFMNISDSIAYRLQTGSLDEERLAKHDQNMILKLAKMDREHTIQKKFDLTEINRTMETLEGFTTGKIVTTCPADKKKIIDCYTKKKGDTLKCENDVKEFINCIDDLLYKATRIDRSNLSVTCPRKMTYRERFERNCLNR